MYKTKNEHREYTDRYVSVSRRPAAPVSGINTENPGTLLSATKRQAPGYAA